MPSHPPEVTAVPMSALPAQSRVRGSAWHKSSFKKVVPPVRQLANLVS